LVTFDKLRSSFDRKEGEKKEGKIAVDPFDLRAVFSAPGAVEKVNVRDNFTRLYPCYK
jgi:hypothetical protein